MSALFHTILTKPIFNILVLFYDLIPPHDLGLAIVLLTIFIRLLLYPLVKKSMDSQRALSALQPEVDKLRETYKDNKEEQAKRLMELYQKHGVNPVSGCLPLLIQLPLLFAMYFVFANATKSDALLQLYSFIPNPGALNPLAFGFIDLAHSSKILAIVAGISQFAQTYVMPQPVKAAGNNPFMQAMQMQMYMVPVLVTIIGFKFPAALPLYWTVLNLLGVVQSVGLRPWRKKVAP